ncbi:MAG: DUF1302 family protein [Betaproteobacteria bacterium]
MIRSIPKGGTLLAAFCLATAAPASAADPITRDELFGITAPAAAPDTAPPADAAPKSREDLFAEPATKAVRVSGFLEGLGAYTYADPTHWSRAVGRLQLTAQGDLGGGVRWKASGRIDADPIYLNSGFYPAAVKRDQRFDAFWRENYLDFSSGDWDFRVGAQQIVWGEVVGLYFADVVSARDMREFLLPSFDVMRIPQWAARAEYTAGDAHLEFIYIPVPAFDIIGKPGSEFYPVPLPSPIPSDVADLFDDPQRPARTLANGNFGMRANTVLAGWDMSAFYYRSFSTSPTFYRVAGGDALQPFRFEPRYDRIWQAGGTVSQDLGPAVLRGEAVYTHGHNFALSNLQSTEDTVQRQTLDYIVSLEWALPLDTRVNVQGFQRIYSGGSSDGIAIVNDGFGASVFVSTKLTPTLEPQILWIRNFRDGGEIIRPRLNWNAARNLMVSVGVDIFSGSTDTFFGRYGNRDRVYTEARLDF